MDENESVLLMSADDVCVAHAAWHMITPASPWQRGTVSCGREAKRQRGKVAERKWKRRVSEERGMRCVQWHRGREGEDVCVW